MKPPASMTSSLRQIPTPAIMAICALAWGAIVAHFALNAKDADEFEYTVDQAQVQAFARQKLSEAQTKSYSDNMELCAIIYEDRSGSLGHTPIVDGDNASCDLSYFDEPGMGPVASIHTHGGFDPEFDSEVPSTDDFEGDIADGIDGYIATPGGRIWRIDAKRELAIQLCGEGCLTQDPDYERCEGGDPLRQYTIDQLRARFVDDSWSC